LNGRQSERSGVEFSPPVQHMRAAELMRHAVQARVSGVLGPRLRVVPEGVTDGPIRADPPHLHRTRKPPGVLPLPGSTGMVPWDAPVVGSKALISLSTKLKLPTSRSPPNSPKLAGGKSDAPGRREWAADDRLQQVPALIENRHGSHTRGSPSLGRKAGGRVGYVDFAGDVLHVERDESECADRAGRRECAGTEAHRGEGAVEYVDAAGPEPSSKE
jgi:hypothetical protein